MFGLREAVLDQDDIGWYNFLMGRPSRLWTDVQHRYFEWLQRINTGKSWVLALIKKVWEVSWDMWDHRNKVRANTITRADLREIELLNERITDQFAEGTRGLGHTDYHWLIQPISTFWSMTSNTKLNGWNQLNWLKLGLTTDMNLKPPLFGDSVS